MGLLSSPVEEGEEGGEEEDAQAPAPSRKLSKMLDTLSVRALFFAGFAYFSVDFFYMPTSQFAGMCACVSASARASRVCMF